jgi:hypothetical protein
MFWSHWSIIRELCKTNAMPCNHLQSAELYAVPKQYSAHPIDCCDYVMRIRVCKLYIDGLATVLCTGDDNMG